MKVNNQPAFGMNLYVETALADFIAASEKDANRLQKLTIKAEKDGVLGDIFFKSGSVPFFELIGKIENTGKPAEKDIKNIIINADIDKMPIISPPAVLVDMIEVGYNHIHDVLTGKIKLWK